MTDSELFGEKTEKLKPLLLRIRKYCVFSWSNFPAINAELRSKSSKKSQGLSALVPTILNDVAFFKVQYATRIFLKVLFFNSV